MKILYEGVDIYPDVSVHRCYHDMYAEKQSDELLLKLNDTRELWDSWNPKKGDTIAIEDGAAKTGKMFVESVVPESGIITLRAYSVPQSAKDKRSKSWEKVKFLQLAQEIAGRHSLTLETYGITDQTYDYVEQNFRVRMPDPPRISFYPDGTIFLSGPIGLSSTRWETSCGISIGRNGMIESVEKEEG